jgi:uncharacterized membrane protein
LLALVGIAGAFPAHADYKYTTVNYPGALCTVLWGINNSGDVLGSASFGALCTRTTLSFVYHRKNGSITVLPTVPGATGTAAIGINEAGVIVGGAGDGETNADVGLILEKGAFTFFVHPGSVETQGRAIGNSGLVTGYSKSSATGIDVPFIYDPTHNSFIDITVPGMTLTPGPFNTAQGINGKGEVVGNIRLDPDALFAGSPGGQYGFLRDRGGAISFFQVNGYGTRARGITESGRIAGWLYDGAGLGRGFVVTLKARGGVQSLTVPDADLLQVPGSIDTFVAGIDNLGRLPCRAGTAQEEVTALA